MNEPFRVNILTIFPEMFDSFFSSSILGRAGEQGLIDIRTTDIRPYSKSKHHNTDDYPFGGGAGMVMMAQPILDAMSAVMAEYPSARRIYLGPRGKKLTTSLARELAQEKELVLLCGHYEGVDQRALDTCVDEEISIGDFVLTGGELPALLIMDAVSRFVPGVLGKLASAEEDSFSSGLLEYPQYTRPVVFEGMEAPEVLRSGNHKLIARWRRKQALKATYLLRPDMLPEELDKQDKKLLEEITEEL